MRYLETRTATSLMQPTVFIGAMALVEEFFALQAWAGTNRIGFQANTALPIVVLGLQLFLWRGTCRTLGDAAVLEQLSYLLRIPMQRGNAQFICWRNEMEFTTGLEPADHGAGLAFIRSQVRLGYRDGSSFSIVELDPRTGSVANSWALEFSPNGSKSETAGFLA